MLCGNKVNLKDICSVVDEMSSFRKKVFCFATSISAACVDFKSLYHRDCNYSELNIVFLEHVTLKSFFFHFSVTSQ